MYGNAEDSPPGAGDGLAAGFRMIDVTC